MSKKQARILIVEDEPHIAADIALRLNGLGYQVLGPVETAREAIRLAETEKPDLVFMDIVLPGDMDGVTAAAHIQRLSIPVIYLTAHAYDELLQRAKITEPLAYLIKPYTARELEAAVVMALYRHDVERQLKEANEAITRAHQQADINERVLSTLLGNLPGMAYRCAAQTDARMEFVSDGCLGLTGYSAEQLLSATPEFHDLIHPDDRKRVWKTIEHTVVGGHFQVEYRMLHADGGYRWVWEQGCVIQGLGGEIDAYEGFITDTTEQHHLSEQLQRALDDLERKVALRESNERFRVMVEVSSDWLWVIGLNGCYSYVSPKVYDILGFAPSQILGKTPFELMPEDEAERVRCVFEDYMARQAPFHCLENKNWHRDGHLVILETSGVPVFDSAGVFRGYRGINRDVTGRQSVEYALYESERHLRQIIDLVPHMIFAKDAEGRHILVNRACADSFGLSVEEVVGRLHSDLQPDSGELRQMLADDRRVIESGQPLLIPEEDYTDAHGVRHILRTMKVPYTPPGDTCPAILGVAIDITEQKRFEQGLAASEQKFRAVLENAVDAIFMCSLDGRIVEANRRASELLGYSKDELLLMAAQDLHPVEEFERLQEVFGKLSNNQTTLVVHPVVRKGGEVIYCEVAANLIQFGNRQLAQGIFRDVSEREQLTKVRIAQEEQHRDTLVREVHHRIKNNLQGVVGLLREHANNNPVLEKALSAAIGQVQSISVVHGLLGQGEDMQIRLCDMVSAIARNASALTRTHVEPIVEFAIMRPVIIDKDEAVPVALVINELILNAVKHGVDRACGHPVQVILTQQGQQAELRIVNVGQLPAGFDYAAGLGIGTGLGLVRSLLPHSGAYLVISSSRQGVEGKLTLRPPVVVA